MDYKKGLKSIDFIRTLIQNTMKSKHISNKNIIDAGLSHNFLYNMKSFYPRSDMLYIISRVLDVPMEYLLTGEEKEPTTNSISIEEKQLLDSYRNLTSESKIALNNVIKTMKKNDETPAK